VINILHRSRVANITQPLQRKTFFFWLRMWSRIPWTMEIELLLDPVLDDGGGVSGEKSCE
jgi:hypothetical protein